jgi:hypothetical protein
VSDQTPPPEGRQEPGPDETTEISRPDAEGGGPGEPPEGEGPGGGGEGEGEEPPEELRCANCDAPLEPDQTYCLECGAPTPAAPKLRRGGRAALVIAGALVILGLGAGALAWAVASDDDGGSTPPAATATGTIGTGTIPTDIVPTDTTGTVTGGTLPTDTTATAPTGTGTLPTDTGGFPTDTTGTGGTLPTTTAGTETAPPETTTEATTTEGTTTSGGGGSGGASDWPAGTSGWTAIVASAKSLGPAEQKKSQLQSSGQPAGILTSSDYSSLNPGYYVVFSGVFQSQSAAAAQAAKVRGQFPGAYPRQITP